MSQENVERLHEIYELMNTRFDALKGGDLDPLLAFFDPEVVIELVDAPDPGTYHGHDGVRSWFNDVFGPWAAYHVKAEDIKESGEWTVALLHTISARRGEWRRAGASNSHLPSVSRRQNRARPHISGSRRGPRSLRPVGARRSRRLLSLRDTARAMSQENVDVFLEGSDALRRGEVEAILDRVSEDVVWIAARSAVEGTYHGHEGLRRFVADNAENFEVFEPNFDEVRDLGARVLAFGRFRIRARGSGVETTFPVAGIATYRDGKLVSWEDFRERHLALEAAGLRE